MTKNIVVVDYGSGNTFSMVNALERVRNRDQKVVLSRDPEVIAGAERVVLPGVGAFAECRRRLDESGALPALTETVARGIPFLGVCVGMQILADQGEEFGFSPGLGWIKGVTRKIRVSSGATNCRGQLKLPHVGWSPINVGTCHLLKSNCATDHFYFVHSYVLDCADSAQIAATAEYGETFCAAVRHENVFGCQFHPEKSARAGLRILENFCRWKP